MTEAMLASLGRFIRGVGYNPDEDLRARQGSDTVELLRANNVQDGRLVLEEVQHVHQRRVRSDQYLTDGDVLICAANGSKRLVGKAAQVRLPDSRELTLGAFMMGFRPNPAKVFPAYVAQQFHSNKYRYWVELLLSGSSINNLRPSAVGELKVWLPNFEEQQRIAQALMDADELIAALERLIAKKQSIKKGMVQQLLTGRTRLPGFTEAWSEIRLGNHVSYVKTVALSRAQLDTKSSLKYLHYGDIHTRSIILLDAAIEEMPRANVNLAARAGQLRRGDLVFADASEDPAGVGKSIEIADTPDTGVVPGLHTIAARFDKSVLADGFKAYLQFIPSFRDQLLRLAAGTKVLATTRSYISSITLTLPAVAEQSAIAETLHDSEREIEALRARLLKARDMKTGMMQQLLTGRVRLPLETVS